MVNAGDIERGAQDSYTFVRVLGKGSYGEVWLAKSSNGTNVAIKVYYRGDKSVIRDMNAELKALRQISAVCGKYAVCVLDSYYSGIAPRIVMEYVQGVPLSKYMRGIPLDQRQGRDDIIKNLIRGLNVLHRAGATHQDIKEENIMWDSRTQLPRYVDWGLACLNEYCERRPVCEPPCGSSGTAYTAPPDLVIGAFNEENFGRAKAHDIWSIGVVLLDWFLMPPNNNACMFYEPGCQVLNKDAPRNQTEEQLQGWINAINNQLAKQVLPLLLKQNWQERLDGWATVMSIVEGVPLPAPPPPQPQPVPAPAPQPDDILKDLLTLEQYTKLLDNFSNDAQLLKSLTPGTYYLRFSSQTPGITVVVNDQERGIQKIGFRPNPADRSWSHMGKSWVSWYELVQHILSSLPGKDYTEISSIPYTLETLEQQRQALEAEKEQQRRAMATFQEQRRQAVVEREAKRQELVQKAFQAERWRGGKAPFTNPAQCQPDTDRTTGKAWAEFLKNPATQLQDIITIPGVMPGTFWCFTKEDIIRSTSFDPQLGTFTNPYTGKTLILAKSDKEALISYSMRSALAQRKGAQL